MQAQSILLFLLLFGLGFAAHLIYRMIREKNGIRKSQSQAHTIIKKAEKQAEEIRNRAENRAKKLVKDRNSQMQKMSSEKRREFSATEKKLKAREEKLGEEYEEIDRKKTELEEVKADLESKYLALEEKQRTLDENIEEIKGKIEEVSGLTRESAKAELVRLVEDDARHEAVKRLKQIEEECNSSAERKAKDIISLAIQRYSGSYTSEKTVSVVNLPSDDVKGRIIGREGRNIRSIELRTGVDIIIDDTPETVVISCFNPIRREVAKISLERLIADGRIHPARIEEVVTEVEKEIEREIQKEGEQALFDLGISGMHPELINKLGMLKYRTSYSQNILNHSIEVGFICGMLASEIGYNEKLAKRAGLLHDIGKAVDHEVEGSHVDIGANIVKKYGEPPEIIDALEKTHDPQPQGILPLLVQAADAISAARPGARRETYENYVKRIESIEGVASSFPGVERCYAIQAGREVRVIVESDQVSDEEGAILSHEIAKKIEKEVVYPGQIKIMVIRESRATAYAS